MSQVREPVLVQTRIVKLAAETEYPTEASGNASATLTVPAGFGTIQAYAEYTVTP
jgi:hypothetical protein